MSLTIYFLLLTVATAVAFPSNEIHLLMPHSGSAGQKHSDLDCLSWRLGVETNNIRDWTAVPQTCEDYVGHYMHGKQYRKDCDLVAEEA
ncbi:acid phosphatase, class B-like protein [Tanacetum coccineum]